MRRLTALLLLCGCAAAQTADSFEAASIKPFPPEGLRVMSGCLGGPGSDDPGRFHCEHVTVKQLLMRAYAVKGQEIAGPDWLDVDAFNIEARVPAGATREQAQAMFRNLLAERFSVVLHREKKMVQGYSLAVAEGGPKIRESAPAAPAATEEERPRGGPPVGADGFPILRREVMLHGAIILYRNGRARLQAAEAPLSAVATALSNQLDQVINDETGLGGKYDVTVTWTPRVGEPGAAPVRPAGESAEASAPGADLFGALKAQLGLALVAKKIEREVLIVDRASRTPTPN